MSKITVHTDMIPTNLEKDINLLIIADMHIDFHSSRKENLKELVQIIEQLNPNYILIPGDSIQSHKSSISNTDFIFKELGNIAPTILSLGNHELEALRDGLNLEWFYNLERFSQVYPLDNSSITIDNIQFTGFSPSLESYLPKTKNPDLFLEELINTSIQIDPNSIFNIMLSHTPDFITDETLRKNLLLASYNLFISGHKHNGCVPEFLEKSFKDRGLIGPYFSLFPNKCRGIIDVYNSKLFISKGYRKITQENVIMNNIDKLFDNDIHQLILTKKK